MISVPTGKHTLAVRRIGYSVAEVQVDLEADKAISVEVRMRRSGTITLDGPPHGVLVEPADSAPSP
jgi:hypothetical protein